MKDDVMTNTLDSRNRREDIFGDGIDARRVAIRVNQKQKERKQEVHR
jgi:hypothetical protein